MKVKVVRIPKAIIVVAVLYIALADIGALLDVLAKLGECR